MGALCGVVQQVKVVPVSTKPFEGQKPGTSGLRKSTRTFMEEHYTENFVQCILEAGLDSRLPGSTVVVGGDGRYYCREAAETIVQICAANRVRSLICIRDSIGGSGIICCSSYVHYTLGIDCQYYTGLY